MLSWIRHKRAQYKARVDEEERALLAEAESADCRNEDGVHVAWVRDGWPCPNCAGIHSAQAKAGAQASLAKQVAAELYRLQKQENPGEQR